MLSKAEIEVVTNPVKARNVLALALNYEDSAEYDAACQGDPQEVVTKLKKLRTSET